MFSIAIMMLAYCVMNKGDAKIAFGVFHEPRAQLLICQNKMLSHPLLSLSVFLSFSQSCKRWAARGFAMPLEGSVCAQPATAGSP